ncbi:MAG: hypothetical protein ABSB54_04100 [Acidimicrobiales bacterium]
MPAARVRVLANLVPVVAAAKTGKSRRTSTTTTTVAAHPLRTASTGATVASLAAGSSIDLTLPALGCQPGGRYVLRIRVGTDVESFTLQVAAG